MLPESVGVEVLLGSGRETRDPLFIPLGIGNETLEPAGFELYEGDHAMIAGPPRSGRTTSLLVVAEVLAQLYPDLELIGMAMRRSALRDCPSLSRVVTSVDELPELAAQLRGAEQLKILLVDDADVVDDPSRALSDLFSAPLLTLHAVVAGRIDSLGRRQCGRPGSSQRLEGKPRLIITPVATGRRSEPTHGARRLPFVATKRQQNKTRVRRRVALVVMACLVCCRARAEGARSCRRPFAGADCAARGHRLSRGQRSLSQRSQPRPLPEVC